MPSRLLPVSVLLIGLAVPAVSVAATEGEMVVTSDTTLTADHHGTISIAADGVTLDCGGHTISVEDGSVGVEALVDEVVIRNCVVFGGGFVGEDWGPWMGGIHVSGSGNLVENNRVVGALLGISGRAVFVDNVVLDSATGFAISSDATVVGNLARDGGAGYYLPESRNVVLEGNRAIGNSGFGYTWDADAPGIAPDNVFRSNVAFRNRAGFVDLSFHTEGGSGSGGVWNVYRGNTCAGNGVTGEWAEDSQSSPLGLCSVLGDGRFVDDDGDTFEADIEWLAVEELTRGCDPPEGIRYCPDDPVTRGELAVFLNRIFDYTDDGGGDLFVDDDGRFYEPAADRIKTAGVTRGCNPPANDRYCGDRPVTRGEFAALFVRAMGYVDNGSGDLFTDDENSPFEDAIDRLATADVTRGCNPPTNDMFCPEDLVTRGQIAAFMHRALAN